MRREGFLNGHKLAQTGWTSSTSFGPPLGRSIAPGLPNEAHLSVSLSALADLWSDFSTVSRVSSNLENMQ